MAKRAAAYLSKELNTTVSLSGIYFKPFKSLVIEDLLVLDLDKDTLLNTPEFMIDINDFSLKRRILDVSAVQINNGTFFLKSYKDRSTNIAFLINYFNSGSPKVKSTKKPFKLTFDKIILINI